MIDPEEVRRSKCGGGVCICQHSKTEWAAHCMDCDNSIGVRGYYDPCARSAKEAGEMWVVLNQRISSEKSNEYIQA